MPRLNSAATSPALPPQAAAPAQTPVGSAPFDLAQITPQASAEPAATPAPFIGPVVQDDTTVRASSPFEPVGRQFERPTLREEFSEFVDNLSTGEKAALGGAYAAGRLAEGHLEFSVPLSGGAELSLDIRTRENRAARQEAIAPGSQFLPNAGTPRGAGASFEIKLPF